jgi:hypothetical protein
LKLLKIFFSKRQKKFSIIVFYVQLLVVVFVVEELNVEIAFIDVVEKEFKINTPSFVL